MILCRPHRPDPSCQTRSAVLPKAWLAGDLKRELLDLWTEERNAYAKEVMTDIEDQRKQRKRER